MPDCGCRAGRFRRLRRFRIARPGAGKPYPSAPVHRPASAPGPRIDAMKRGGGMPAVCPAALFSFAPVFPAPDFLGDCSGSVCCFRAYPGRRFFSHKKAKSRRFLRLFCFTDSPESPDSFRRARRRGFGSWRGLSREGERSPCPYRAGSIFRRGLRPCARLQRLGEYPRMQKSGSDRLAQAFGCSHRSRRRFRTGAVHPTARFCAQAQNRGAPARFREHIRRTGRRAPARTCVCGRVVRKPRLSGFGRRHCAHWTLGRLS